MTVRVTTLKGSGAGVYYTERLPSYYLDAGEPAGRWYGRGAALLGLDGPVNDSACLTVMAGEHPATGERLGRRYGDESVRGFDATFSAPKSVSVPSPDVWPSPASRLTSVPHTPQPAPVSRTISTRYMRATGGKPPLVSPS